MSVTLNNLCLNNIGCFNEINIKLRDNINILCGANGVGKTTILESIATLFAGSNHPRITKNVLANRSGSIQYHAKLNWSDVSGKITVNRYMPEENNKMNDIGLYHAAINFIFIRTLREISYVRVDSLKRDPIKSDHTLALEAAQGLKSEDLKEWFARRYLFKNVDKGLKRVLSSK